jgi:predicted secreted protein
MKHFINALLAGVFSTQLALADEAPRYNQISLSAEVSEQVSNDTMHVTLNTYGEHRDAAQLAAQINRDMAWALALVKTQPGVKAASGSYQTWPLTSKDGRTTTGWRGQQSLELESKDSEQLGKVTGDLQERLKISDMNFTVSDDKRNSVENRLIDNALDAFEARAQIIASNLKAGSYRIVSINIGSSSQPPPVLYQPRVAMATMEADSAVAVESGESEVAVNVSGTIELVMP